MAKKLIAALILVIGCCSLGFADGCLAEPSPLQKHTMFFDQNNDCIIHREETARGLEQLQVDKDAAEKVSGLIHTLLARLTACPETDKSQCPIDIKKLPRHASNTAIFNPDGSWNQQEFERIFDRYDENKTGYLNEKEIHKMVSDNASRDGGRDADIAMGGFMFLLSVAADHKECPAQCRPGETPLPAIGRERLRKNYEGTLFWELGGRTPPWATSTPASN